MSHACCQESQNACGACRHAQRLLKYGFDLGPQFSPDSNLPPDETDSMPASVRRNAPSNVILNIADLRNSMLENALEPDDDTPHTVDATAQPLSIAQQQSLVSPDTGPPAVQLHQDLHDNPTQHNPSEQSADDSQGVHAYGPGSQAHNEGSADHLTLQQQPSSSAAGIQTEPAAVVNEAADEDTQYESTVRQYGRSLSAMRGSRSRPRLASVRFAAEPDDDPSDGEPGHH